SKIAPLSLLLSYLLQKVNQLAGVSPLVVVPGDYLDEVRVEGDAGLSVEDGCARIAQEVLRYDFIFRVTQDAFKFAFGGVLHCFLNLIVGCGFFEAYREVDNGYIGNGHAERHAGEFAFEFGDNEGYRLCRPGRGGYNILVCTAATTPVFQRGPVNRLLRSGNGVNGAHESFHDAKVVIKHCGYGCEAVRGARCVRYDRLICLKLLVVHTHDEGRRIVLGRSGKDDLAGACLYVFLRQLLSEEKTGGFNDDLSADVGPFEVGRVAFCGDADFLSIDNERAIFYGNVPFETTVG